MIHEVLSLLVNDVNAFLKRTIADSEDRLILSGLVDQSGNLAFTGDNHMVCTLTAIEQERTNLNHPMTGKTLKNPPIYLNLYLLFSAHFPDKR